MLYSRWNSKLKTELKKESGKRSLLLKVKLIKLKLSFHSYVSRLLISGQNCSRNLFRTKIVLIHLLWSNWFLRILWTLECMPTNFNAFTMKWLCWVRIPCKWRHMSWKSERKIPFSSTLSLWCNQMQRRYFEYRNGIMHLLRSQDLPPYPLIRTLSCAYQGVRNVSFSENFVSAINEWSLTNKILLQAN